MDHMRSLQTGKWHDQTFGLGELYVYTGVNGRLLSSSPPSWVVFVLTRIEHVVFGATPEQRYRFCFEPALNFWPEENKHLAAEYVTAEPSYMRRIDVLAMCRARLSLDTFINSRTHVNV